MTNTVAAKPITDLVFARLSVTGGPTAYRGEVADSPPKLLNSDRVAPYVVFYPFPGKPGSDPDQQTLGYGNVDLDWSGQFTCVAGFEEDCEALVDWVHERLFGWSPAPAGLVVGQLRPPVGFSPGTPQADRSILPPRYSLVLQYRLTATAN